MDEYETMAGLQARLKRVEEAARAILAQAHRQGGHKTRTFAGCPSCSDPLRIPERGAA